MIEIKNLTVRFGGVKPLDRLNLSFDRPICGLIGPNGAGKTTLLDVLSGFVRPEAGEVVMDGVRLGRMSPRHRARRGMRRTFQRDAVVDRLTPAENVALAREHIGVEGVSDAELMVAVGLDPDDSRPARILSTGERRKVELARALVGRPRTVLLDEPGAGMTNDEGQRLGELIHEIPGRFDTQLVLIDHDIDLVARVCEEVAVIDFGQLVASGDCADVLADARVRAAYLGTTDLDLEGEASRP